MSPRPVCACHGEPMASNGTRPSNGKRKYQCSVKNRARMARWKDNCTYLQYAHRLLRDRRRRALRRMEARRGSV